MRHLLVVTTRGRKVADGVRRRTRVLRIVAVLRTGDSVVQRAKLLGINRRAEGAVAGAPR